MRKGNITLRIFVWIALCFGGMELIAQDVESPFMAPRVNDTPVEPTKPTSNPLDHMEFDGYMSMNGKTLISLYDRKERRSYWVEVNTKNSEGFEISKFEPQSKGGEDVVVLKHGRNSKRIQLKNSDILTLAPTSAPVNAAANTNRKTPTRANTSTADKESDEEVRERMKRVAEEIRRRRAMRRSLVDGKNSDNAAN